MVSYRVDEVKLAWTDNGNKMWHVTYSRVPDGPHWVMRHWAKDEIDAYNIAIKKLGANNG